MDTLPQELVNRISSHLTRNELKQTLTLNKAFGSAAEKYSEGLSDFSLTKENVQKFKDIYGGPRFGLLRHVTFRTHLAPLVPVDGVDPACRETEDDLAEKNESFTEQVKFLFETLKELEERAGSCGPGRIKITIYSPVRRVEISCLHRFYSSWRVRLLQPQDLPELRSVQALQVEQVTRAYGCLADQEISRLDLRVIVDLASRLPNLEYVGCRLGQNEVRRSTANLQLQLHYTHDWEGPQRDTRHHFARAIETIKFPPSLQRARLNFVCGCCDDEQVPDQRQQMPDLVTPAQRDPFSSALYSFSQSLRVLEIRAIVDLNLFQRYDNDQSIWPNLETFSVMFHPVSPSGVWYFEGPDGEFSDTANYTITPDHYPPLGPNPTDAAHDASLSKQGPGEDISMGSQFRVTPHEANLLPFLTAFATATSRMPKLKHAMIWSPMRWDPDAPDPDERPAPNDEADDEEDEEYWPDPFQDAITDRQVAWGISYSAPIPAHRDPKWGPRPATSRQLTWQVLPWQPDAEVVELFRNIGREAHGEALEEEWDEVEAPPIFDMLPFWRIWGVRRGEWR